MRITILAVSVVFLGLFLILTIHAALDRGFTVLSVTSFFVLAIMGIGIIGAIWQGFDDDE